MPASESPSASVSPRTISEGVIETPATEVGHPPKPYNHNHSLLHENTNGAPVNGDSQNGSLKNNGTPTNAVLDDHTEPRSKASNETIRVPLSNVPAYTVPRKLRLITIGAGFSGLTFAHKLRYEHPEMENIVTNTIFESRAEIGGTWLANTYPGVQCDVPSHIYAFPFDPYPDWSHFYSTGAEIHDYMRQTVKKWNLDRDVQLNTRVVSVYWEEEPGQWKVTVEHKGVLRDEYADIIISAQGFLNAWKWPDIPGLHDFQGHKVHSAAWDHSYDYSHKRIAVIGNGSSGIQILPKLAKLEGTDVTSFQRSPSWIVSRMDPEKLLGKPNLGDNPEYTEEDKKVFRENPEVHHQYRKNLIHSINKAFQMVS